ncbi:MAG: hypothetical protein ISS26_03620 [Candidatus Omnitrophica bacterium]|nr:hypothetical protein [Candidatus Omnitrophota bacterium]
MRWLRSLLIVFLVVNIAGCAELRRKFVKKSETKPEERSFYRIEEYQPKPPHERYKESYMMWHNWHLDLLRTEGNSRKRDINSASEALKHLTAMRDLLAEEKAGELDEQAAKLQGIIDGLKNGRSNVMDDINTRKAAERMERTVINMYSYNKMKEFIKTAIELKGGENE